MPYNAPMLLHIGMLIAGGALLWFGAGWIVDSASAIARKLRVSELVIGLTVVAMGTSAPEFLVTLMAAFKGLPDLSLANVAGSNIFNLGIILGIMALIRPIPTHRTILFRDGLALLAVHAVTLAMVWNLYLGRVDGAILVALFVLYLGYLLFRARQAPDPSADPELSAFAAELPEQREAAWWDYPRLLGGFVAIAGGSELLVNGATAIALALGVSSWVIGLTVVAAGTSLPELVTCIAASLKAKNDLLLGSLLGSDFFNFAGVLGITCLLRPLAVSPAALPGMIALVGFMVLVLVFIRSGWRIGRLEGAALITLGLARWGMNYWFH